MFKRELLNGFKANTPWTEAARAWIGGSPGQHLHPRDTHNVRNILKRLCVMIVKSLYPGSLITVSWLCFPECTHLSGGQAHDYAGRKHFTECCNRKLFHVSDIEHPTSLAILMTESHAQLCCKFLCYIMLFKLRNKK